jgi:hypothetical protein
MRIPCTCGCGEQVTHATKINHLNGRGKTSLRARVLEENESLKLSTRRQPVLLQDHQKKKRSHPSSNQAGNRKRLKADQIDVDLPAQAYADPMESLPTPGPNQGPESPIQTYTDQSELPPTSAPNQEPDFLFQAYTDPTELPLTPVSNQVPEIPAFKTSTDITESTPTLVPNQAPDALPVSQADAGPKELPSAPEPDSGIEDGSADALSSARRSNKIAERTRDVTERRWGNSHLRDEIPKSDRGGGSDRCEDEEDVDLDLNMTGDEDSGDEDSDDEDSNDEDREEDDDDLFAESGVTGISAWDLLGEGFEREVVSIGMFLAQDSSVMLTIF